MGTRRKTSRVKRLLTRAKGAVGSALDFGHEGTAALRLTWEVHDIIAAEGLEPMMVGLPAAASASRAKAPIAARRMTALGQRKHPVSAAFLSATPVMAGHANWVQIGPTAIPNGQASDRQLRILVSGRITDIAVHPTDPSTIYIASARGGVWRTTDGGKNWTPLTDNEASLANGAIAIAPSDPSTIYIGTGEGNLEFYVKNVPLSSSPDNYLGVGILKSTGSGDVWVRQGAVEFTGAGCFRIAVHPTNAAFAFAATSNGLFRTTDGGGTWVAMKDGLPAISATIIAACDVVINAADPNVAFAAFFGDGIYRTANALAANPAWKKITKGVPATTRRIVMALAPSLPSRIYALFTDDEDFSALSMSRDAGVTWTDTGLSADIGSQSSYNLDLNVDPTTPDVLYISALSLYKVTHTGDQWEAADIGQGIHSDHHCLAFDPKNPLVLYAGCDGGIYKSSDGGATWSDVINRGMTITQFEFIDQHPTSDAVIFGGTQDNGTQQYRNSEIFYHSDEGDGSFVAIDPITPSNVVHGFFSRGIGRSTGGGEFDKWDWTIGDSITADCLFYPPFALDGTPNPMSIAFGGDSVVLDSAQGTGGWKTIVTLPGLGEARVSALEYVSANLIYAGTTDGTVYKLTNDGGKWKATMISAAPLPARWIWDVVIDPDDSNTIYVVFSGFATQHVFRGKVTAAGAAWNAVSGAGANALPDAPVFAMTIKPGPPKTFFIGTDVGVYSSTDPAGSWTLFSSGLPNTAIYDLQYHEPSDLLRAGTHGRGLWERRLDHAPSSDVDIFLRDSVMDSGRRPQQGATTTAAFSDQHRLIAIGDPVGWWQSADIKIDALEPPPGGGAPEYQMLVSEVNDLTFETALAHRTPQRGRVNRVYVQVHNRGIRSANVTVKLLCANACGAVLPPLPADFWTAFPANGDATNWKPVGDAATVSIPPGRSTVLEWDWTPGELAQPSFLAVCDSGSDPIPAASKTLDVNALVRDEKRATLLSLRVVDNLTALPASVDWAPLSFFGDGATAQFNLAINAINAKDLAIVVPKQAGVDPLKGSGKVRKLTAKILNDLRKAVGSLADGVDVASASVITIEAKDGTAQLPVSPGAAPIRMFVGIGRPAKGRANVTFVQKAGDVVRGGCTIIVDAP